MKVADFDYELPHELIAQVPLEAREEARLMVLERKTARISHHVFRELRHFLSPGDLLVLNNTRVIRARLFGHRLGRRADHGTKSSRLTAKIEVLLIKELQPLVWEVLVKPGRKMRVGEVITFGAGELRGEVVARKELGLRTLRFQCSKDFSEMVKSLGHVPLPPYIQRSDVPADVEHYQTVYAKHPGAVAAPTAGLHFTRSLLEQLQASGIHKSEITLHVGLGTFRPVHVEEVERHPMHSEPFEIPEEAAEEINAARERQRRIVAVGTTAVRSLEHVARQTDGRIIPFRGETDLFIYPGFSFRVVNALITNFHLPKSTLLMLVAAFAGREFILEAYRQAIDQRYRFFSYGDAMLIL